MIGIRRAWAKVAGILVFDPVVLATGRYTMDDVHAAVPEGKFPQPRGFERSVAMSRKILPIHRAFAEGLAVFVGTCARSEDDLAPIYAALQKAISLPVPIYFEDDATGTGQCAICGKRGALGRCAQCGLLFHIRCMGTPEPGAFPSCPRCAARTPSGAPAEGLRARPRFGKGALSQHPVGRERGLEPGVPCPLDERPTDEEAQRHGFSSAQEWYVKSASGALVHPDCAEAAFLSLPVRSEEETPYIEGISQD